MNKSCKGITLIALVITIIVLLILSGVSISALSGENGILGRAKDAATNTNKATAEEKVKIMLADYSIEKYSPDGRQSLLEYFNAEKEKGEIDEVTDNNDGTYTVEVDGYEVVVKTDDFSIVSTDKVGGVRPQIATTIYQTDGSATVDGTTYDQVVITVKVTNKSDLTSVDSIVVKNSSGTELIREENVIGDSSAYASYKVTQGGTYTIIATGTKDGIQKSKTVKVTVTQISARVGISVGDYINYTPDDETNAPYTTLTSANTGLSNNSNSIVQDTTMKWQVLKINVDGSMDIIGSPTSQSIWFQGPLGYNNGVYIMNDICEKLYSKGSIKARSVNVEDIEYWLTDAGKAIKNNYTSGIGCKVGETRTYTGGYSCYPNLFSQENGAGINTTTVKADGIGVSEKTSKDLIIPTTQTYSQANISGLTVKQNYWHSGNNNMNSTNFGNGVKVLYNSTSYWVASRFVDCGSSYANFGLRIAGTVFGGPYVYNSSNSVYGYPNRLRPVVSLRADTQITVSPTASTDLNTPHTITKY